MTGCLSVFITTSSHKEAEKIAQVVVEENLAACVNIISGVQSLYRWQGRVEQAQECAIVLKTTMDKFGQLQLRIKELHSHECPCIVATPIVAGNEDYLKWIKG